MTKFYEDIEVDDRWSTEAREVTREEMVGFARRYDPQEMHVDEDEARETFFGGLVASGWFTASASMRLVVDEFLNKYAVVGAMGVDDLRWHEPVRPGDVLHVRGEVVGKETWDENRGLVRYEQETVREEDDDIVMSLSADVLFERRG
jgi:acyl dehydratase